MTSTENQGLLTSTENQEVLALVANNGFVFETILNATINTSTPAQVVDLGGYSQFAVFARMEGPANATAYFEVNFDGYLVFQENVRLNAQGWVHFTKIYPIFAPTVAIVFYNPPAPLKVHMTIYAAGKGATDNPNPSPVQSQGSATLRGTYWFDFDAGAETQNGAEVFWEQVDNVTRRLVPRNGATMAYMGQTDFDAVSLQTLQTQAYSTTPIDGSNNAGNQLTPGSVIAIHTDAGRYAKVRINTYDYNLGIDWVTYA